MWVKLTVWLGVVPLTWTNTVSIFTFLSQSCLTNTIYQANATFATTELLYFIVQILIDWSNLGRIPNKQALSGSIPVIIFINVSMGTGIFLINFFFFIFASHKFRYASDEIF